MSTVNNTATNFDNETFAKDAVLSWNPNGGASFRLIGCTVTSVAYEDGTTSTSDPIVGMQIAGANSRVAAKLVDLDTQQQGVSQIWGLTVRLTNGSARDSAPVIWLNNGSSNAYCVRLTTAPTTM